MIGKMMELWRKWFGKVMLPVVENDKVTAPEKKEAKTRKSTLLDDLEGYLFARYDFRFNVLTEQTEYRPKGEGAYVHVDNVC